MYFSPAHMLVKVAYGFSVGDYVLHGKFRNKRARIVRIYMDERGIPMIEIEPIPKGRKKNRVMGLYTIRKMPPGAIAETKLREKTGSA